MAVPRATLMLSIGTALVLLLSGIWVGLAAWNFTADLEASFGPPAEAPEIDGRYAWEVDLLFDTCMAREGDWQWPENLSGQDDVFLYPGELRCDWEHQGDGDRASVAIYNRGNQTLDIVLEIIGGEVVFASEGDTMLTVNEIGVNETAIVEIQLNNAVTEHDIQIQASHLNVREAEVLLDVHIFEGSNPRDLHASDGDNLEVHYKVWDADTEQLLDEGDLIVTAGDDSNFIQGFGWSAIGLDIDGDRGLIPGIDTGTTHITLLPPPIAYGNSDGHELQESWLRFELKVDRATI